MTHYSKRVAVKLIGEQIKLPTEIHVTYCGLEVKPSKIDNENPECEDCQDWLIWDETDNQGVHN